MSVSSSFVKSATVGGKTISGTISRSGDGQNNIDATLPVADDGTLTTRTDNDTGVVTVGSGHAFATSDVVDVFWDGGYRMGMVATVAGNDVTVDGGSGDNLPVEDTAVTISERTAINVAFDGDDVQLIIAKLNDEGVLSFNPGTSGEVEIHLDDSEPWSWNLADSSPTNPLAGMSVTQVGVSQKSSADAGTFQLGVIYDATP